MKAIILEDEPAATENLQLILTEVAPEIELVGSFDSVRAAEAWLAEQPMPDLIFSDIQLADGLAFHLFERQKIDCPLIFITAFDEYAIRAFELNSISYLLKPVRPAEVQKALQKLRKSQGIPPTADLYGQLHRWIQEERGTHYRQSFLVRYRDQYLPVAVEDFAYFYIDNELVFGQTKEVGIRYLIDQKLEELEQQLAPNNFFRANRQLVVARNAIHRLKQHTHGRLQLFLEPAPPEMPLVSKAKAGALKQWLDR
ncbi:MAG: LytTR family DNA-binding domain-containing protein [Bacteroidota bacterium]